MQKKAMTNKKKERCVCGCGDMIINPFEEDDVIAVEPYPYDYE